MILKTYYTLKPGIPKYSFKYIGTYSKKEKKLRLFSFRYNLGTPGDGIGTSNRISFGFHPILFKYQKESEGFRLTILGFFIHKQKSYGGSFL